MKKLPLRRKLLFALVVALGSLGCVEVGFRVYWAIRQAERASNVEFDPVCDFRLRAGIEATFGSHGDQHPFTTNALHHRGPAPAGTKPANGFRVACLGASTAFGFGVTADDRTYPAVLESSLRAARPDRTIEVLNAGCPGWRLRHSLDNFAVRLEPLDFDLVVINHASNDLYDGADPVYQARSRRAPGEVPPESLGSWLLRQSDFMRYAARRALRNRRDREKLTSHAPEGLAAFERNLDAGLRYFRERGVRVLLCTEPHMYPATQAEAEQIAFDGKIVLWGALRVAPLTYEGLRRGLDVYNDAVRAAARRHGVDLIDLERLVPDDPAYYVDYIHQNDAGARLMGERLAEHIIRAGYLEPGRGGEGS